MSYVGVCGLRGPLHLKEVCMYWIFLDSKLVSGCLERYADKLMGILAALAVEYPDRQIELMYEDMPTMH